MQSSLTHSKAWQPRDVSPLAALFSGDGCECGFGVPARAASPLLLLSHTVTQWVQHGVWEDCGPFPRLGNYFWCPDLNPSHPLFPKSGGNRPLWLRLLPTSQPVGTVMDGKAMAPRWGSPAGPWGAAHGSDPSAGSTRRVWEQLPTPGRLLWVLDGPWWSQGLLVMLPPHSGLARLNPELLRAGLHPPQAALL